MPNPWVNEELYDCIRLDGMRSPGFVTLSGHDRNFKWDIKDADGAGGAITTYKGPQIAQFTASFYLVVDPSLKLDEFEEWEKFAALIRSSLPQKGRPKAMVIYHPDLAANDIHKVCYASIGGMVHDGKGGGTVAVKFLEFRPSKPTGGTPTGPKVKVDPNADLKGIILGLTAEVQRP